MQRNNPSFRSLPRTLIAASLAIGLNATLLGTLANQPTRGQSFLLAQNPVAMPMMVGSVTFGALKAGFQASFGHAARDLRHAERNMLRGIHHGARTVGALVSWSGEPADAAPTC